MDMEPEQEIENRSVRSGASKRKKRKDQLDEWIRLQSKLPRLLSFGLSIQNEPNHSTLLQAGTLETAAAEHQCLDVVNNAHDSVNETEPSATMLAPSNDWQPSDPCSSSQSSRPMDEYVPISMLQAPLDVCISVHSCDTSCSSSQSSQSYTLDTTATTAAINDPAKWTVTDNLREYWVLHGPTRCYNNDGRQTGSVTSPLTPATLRDASSTAGAAAYAAECRKHTANDAKCQELGWACIPLAVETFGNWGMEAQGVFSRLASALGMHQGTSKSWALHTIYSRLNMSLVRSVARSILGRSYVV
ncbi:hypothetical protein EMCRGX_G018282 [Ephydatia muelleri]